MIKKILFLFLFLTLFFGRAQSMQLSSFSEISIVTSGPGELVYEKFGHTAIRVKDPMLQLDLIYNYGIFDFSGPHFFYNFAKGYMNYKLARYPFHYAVKSTKIDGRWMKEQVLNLTNEEKNAFFKFLETNAAPKNASYLYDPFFNNCATRPIDILKKVGGAIIWDETYSNNQSFRELMNAEINQNTWGSLGINIALGSKLDRKATASEYLYLPDYVQRALASAEIISNGTKRKLVAKTQTILDFDEKEAKSDLISPLLIFSIFFILGGYITYNNLQSHTRNRWFDFTLLFVTGVAGCIILFLWFFTNHSTAPNNFNVLWAFPINLIVAFFTVKKTSPKWLLKYYQFLLILLLVIPFVWLFKIQLFNWTLIPLLLLLGSRYFFLQKKLLTSKK